MPARRRRFPLIAALWTLLIAALLVPVGFAPAGAAPGDPEAGTATEPPADYAGTRLDLESGDRYHYARNGAAQANITTRTAGNDGTGTFQPGWLADFTLDGGPEVVDWTEWLLTEDLPAANAWNNPDQHLPLGDVAVDGDAITASGTAVAAPDVDASVTYRMLPGAPVLKMSLELRNTGSSAYDGYFHYLMDPDSGSDTAVVPGVGGTNPGLVTSGWTDNYVYDGPTAASSTSPAQGIAWYDDEPAAISANGYIFGVWFDAEVPAGGTRTITWYQISDFPGADPTASVAGWAGRLDTLDTDLEAQPRITGRVADTATAEGVPGVEVVAKNIDGETVDTATTDADGAYQTSLPVGTYTLTATRLGYESASRSIEVTAADPAPALDFEMVPIRAGASTGKRLPGGIVEATTSDIVMENQNLAMAISAGSQDSQLDPTTPGKPRDLAATGMADEIDWLNLPWVSTTRPSGSEAWQSLTVANDTVEITESGPDRGEVTAQGTWTEDPSLEVATSYVVEPEQPWVTAESVFTNTSGEPMTVWLGDVIDNDAGGQMSYVPGTGAVSNPHGNPAAFEPTQPWIAQTGDQPQVYGLLYTGDRTDFDAYGASTWMSSQFEATIPAGGSYRLERRVVALATESDADRQRAFVNLYEDYQSEQTGISMQFTVADDSIDDGGSTTATARVSSTRDTAAEDVEVALDLPANLATDDPLTRTVTVPAGGEETLTWDLTATGGGRGNVSAELTFEGQTLSRTRNLFVNGPGWYWGDNHTHSTHSDGSGTIADNFASARRYGLSWLVATDHNTISQADDVAQEDRDDFVALFGEEITNSDGHSLGYNIDELVDWTQPAQGRVDQTNASNGGDGFFFVAHPYYPGLEWDDWSIEDYAGIEVWNGFYPPRHTVNTSAFAKWDELNRAGKHLAGIANSDAHNPGKVGSPHVRAYLPELADTEVWRALESGTFYGTDGPDLRFNMAGASMGEDLASPASGRTVTATLTGLADQSITELVLLKDGEPVQTWTPGTSEHQESVELDVTPGEFYRVELMTETGRFAFSNPIWVVEGEAEQATPTITADDVTTPASEAADVAVEVTGDGPTPTGEITLSDGDGEVLGTADLVDGAATVEIPAGTLPVGDHRLTVGYSGDDAYVAADAPMTVSVTGTASTTEARVTPKRPKAGKRPKVHVAVRADGAPATGRVRVEIPGHDDRTAMLRDGKTRVRLPEVSSGEVTITVVYPGSAEVARSEDTVTFRVRP